MSLVKRRVTNETRHQGTNGNEVKFVTIRIDMIDVSWFFNIGPVTAAPE